MYNALRFCQLLVCTAGLIAADVSHTAAQGEKGRSGEKTISAKKNNAPVEVRLSDGSILKIVLKDQRIELNTDYGKLLIPVADIGKIEFSLRIPPAAKKQIEKAVADLGNPSFRLRETANMVLLRLKEQAYPALLRATKGKDAEVTSRAEKLLEKIRELVGEEDLQLPPHDIVYTRHSKIAGYIESPSFKIQTLAFGEQQLDLAKVRTLQLPMAKSNSSAAALPDPGRMTVYQAQVGKTLTFRVTAPPAAIATQMGVFGTDVYTVDSNLAASSVHAGVLKPGETGLVRVTIVGAHPGFQATQRNGVISHPWGAWTGFRFEKKKRK